VASRKSGDHLDGAEVAKSPVKIAGVVSLAGITDMRAYAAGTGSCNHAVGPLMGGTAAEVPNRYAAVEPIGRSPIGVPIRFVHGSDDSIVPVSQSQSMLDRERANGGNVRISIVEGAGHFDLVAPVSKAWPEVMAAIRDLTKSP
jgi:pimeloyl-ACP methyl ester carboxylesterase